MQAVYNAEVVQDPTLPRDSSVPCPACGNAFSVYFSTHSKNQEETMKLIYVCLNESCNNMYRQHKPRV